MFVAEVEDNRGLPRLGLRVVSKQLIVVSSRLGRGVPPPSGARREVIRSLRLVLASLRGALRGCTLLQHVLHLGGESASMLVGIFRELSRLSSFVRRVSLVRVLDRLALRFVLEIVLARVIFADQF